MATYYGWHTYYCHLLRLAHLLWPLTMAGALAASASFSAVPHAASTLAAPSSLANSTVARPTPPAADVTNTVSLGLELDGSDAVGKVPYIWPVTGDTPVAGDTRAIVPAAHLS